MPESRGRLTARKVAIKDLLHGKYYQQEGFDPNYVITPTGLRASRVRVVGTVVDTYQNEESSYGAFVIDDGTETVRAKLFQDLGMMEEVAEGAIVEVVGKVKEYEDERYLAPELIITRSPNFELLRALEVEEMQQQWKSYREQVQELQDGDASEEDIIEEMKAEGLSEEDTQALLTYLSAEEQFEAGGSAGTSTAGPEPQLQQKRPEPEDGEDSDLKSTVLAVIDDLDGEEGAEYGDIVAEVDAEEEELESVINDLLSDGTCYEPRPGRIKRL